MYLFIASVIRFSLQFHLQWCSLGLITLFFFNHLLNYNQIFFNDNPSNNPCVNILWSLWSSKITASTTVKATQTHLKQCTRIHRSCLNIFDVAAIQRNSRMRNPSNFIESKVCFFENYTVEKIHIVLNSMLQFSFISMVVEEAARFIFKHCERGKTYSTKWNYFNLYGNFTELRVLNHQNRIRMVQF